MLLVIIAHFVFTYKRVSGLILALETKVMEENVKNQTQLEIEREWQEAKEKRDSGMNVGLSGDQMRKALVEHTKLMAMVELSLQAQIIKEIAQFVLLILMLSFILLGFVAFGAGSVGSVISTVLVLLSSGTINLPSFASSSKSEQVDKLEHQIKLEKSAKQAPKKVE